MSKQIKQMEMDALKQTFQDVQDCVLLSVSGVNAQTDHQMRMTLRRKNIRLQVVKNSLARRVFDELGMQIPDAWSNPTLVAWGAGSLSELSRELNQLIKKNENIKVKTALSERQPIPFQKALDMPTRAEAVARIVGLVLAPASRLVSQLQAPGGRLAGQIKTLAERTPEEPAPAAS